MLTNDLGDFERVCTIERDDHLLFTIQCYGNTQYLLYHIPSKTVLISRSFQMTPRIIKTMIDRGVRVADDPRVAAYH